MHISREDSNVKLTDQMTEFYSSYLQISSQPSEMSSIGNVGVHEPCVRCSTSRFLDEMRY